MSVGSGRLERGLVPGTERAGGVRNRVAETFRFSAVLERLLLENSSKRACTFAALVKSRFSTRLRVATAGAFSGRGGSLDRAFTGNFWAL